MSEIILAIVLFIVCIEVVLVMFPHEFSAMLNRWAERLDRIEQERKRGRK